MTTADGATVVATAGPQLVVRDARDGSVRRSIPVPPGLVVKALSGDGTMAALSAPDPGPATPSGYLPAGRTATTIVVVDLKSGSVTRHDLAGSLTPEAFSTDNRSVFVISYLPAQAPDRYVVSSLDLTSGVVDGVFGREKEPPEEMQGIGRTHTLAPDRTALYTLYLRPPTGAANRATRAEVHTLSLNGAWAHCIDLPEEFGKGDLSTASIAVSPEGGRLYVVDGTAHRLAEIDTYGLTVTRIASIAPSTKAGRTTVTAGSRASGRIFIGDGSGVQVITDESLAPLTHWYTDSPVTALATTPSGGVVATTVDKVYVFDADGAPRITARPSGDVVSVALAA
jgi:DNA-binding beta-propeller fold protein YncE